jgi:hypothetical protein
MSNSKNPAGIVISNEVRDLLEKKFLGFTSK